MGDSSVTLYTGESLHAELLTPPLVCEGIYCSKSTGCLLVTPSLSDFGESGIKET